jgi:hypothetical protein
MYDTIKIFRTGRSHMAVLTRVNRPAGGAGGGAGAGASYWADDEASLAGGSIHGGLHQVEGSSVGLVRRSPSIGGYGLAPGQIEAQVGGRGQGSCCSAALLALCVSQGSWLWLGLAGQCWQASWWEAEGVCCRYGLGGG